MYVLERVEFESSFFTATYLLFYGFENKIVNELSLHVRLVSLNTRCICVPLQQ